MRVVLFVENTTFSNSDDNYSSQLIDPKVLFDGLKASSAPLPLATKWMVNIENELYT